MANFNQNNEVLSFHIYMWNKWNQAEAAAVFNQPGQEWQYSLGEHLWNKWLDRCNQVGATAAVSIMVMDLDEGNLNKLIQRACKFYNGRRNR